MDMKITKKQLELLRKLDEELEGGAREELRFLLIRLKGELAAQKLDQTCKTSDLVAQLVNYNISFEGRDGELKLTYHNSSITDANFKAVGMLQPFEQGSAVHEFKVYRPNRRISTENAIALMKKDGYRPATALELLEYYVAELLHGAIVQWFLLVALGTVWQGNVVYLLLDPAHRVLGLNAFGHNWSVQNQLLAVREF